MKSAARFRTACRSSPLTGIKTPVGIKFLGPDLFTIERIGREIETGLKDVEGTRGVYAERVAQG